MEKRTKTLLFTNIQDPNFTINLKSKYEIREVYSIPNNNTLLFVIFYNLKEAEKCYKDLIQNHEVIFTISKYELPKDQEKCDKDKNQSTLFITIDNIETFNTDEDILNTFGEVKDIRNANPTTKCVEYFDSRSADKCYEYLSKKYPVKYVWDMSTKTKWDIIRLTDSVIGQQVPVQKKKRNVVHKNMFIKEFDDFIIENIDKLEISSIK